MMCLNRLLTTAIFLGFLSIPPSTAFHVASPAAAFVAPVRSSIGTARSMTESPEDSPAAAPSEKKVYNTAAMEMFLQQKYPAFMNLVSSNDIWDSVSNGEGGYTVFVPNNAAFDALGKKKLSQLIDPRNAETAERIGAFHACTGPITAEELFKSGGIKTLGGEVTVGRKRSGGLLGLEFLGEEDGGVTVNGANVVESFEVTTCIVHEVDALISPNALWRYMDQLRIDKVIPTPGEE